MIDAKETKGANVSNCRSLLQQNLTEVNNIMYYDLTSKIKHDLEGIDMALRIIQKVLVT